MWIIIRGVRYNFNRIGFYYALGDTIYLLDERLDTKHTVNIKCKTSLEANELVEQIDNRTGAQTL